MSKKIITYCLLGLLLGSMVGVQFVDVAEANPIAKMGVKIPSDAKYPVITSLFPQNYSAYSTANVSFSFNLSEPNSEPKGFKMASYTVSYQPSWQNYSTDVIRAADYTIDSDNASHSVNVSFTVSNVPNGNQSILISTKAEFINVTSPMSFYYYYLTSLELVYFGIDTIAPEISNLSIQNNTAGSVNVQFNTEFGNSWTAISWVGYSLDTQANATVNGNFTLNGLEEGTHIIIIYCNDTLGNMGKSEYAFFKIVNPTPSPTQQPKESNIAEFIPYILIVMVFAIALGALFYFRKKRK